MLRCTHETPLQRLSQCNYNQCNLFQNVHVTTTISILTRLSPSMLSNLLKSDSKFFQFDQYPRLLVYQIFCCIGNYLLWKFSLWSLRTPHKSLLATFFCKLFLHSLVFSKYFPNKTNFINRPLYIPPPMQTHAPLNNPIHQNMRGPNCLGISDILPPLWISEVFIILILMILSDFYKKCGIIKCFYDGTKKTCALKVTYSAIEFLFPEWGQYMVGRGIGQYCQTKITTNISMSKVQNPPEKLFK